MPHQQIDVVLAGYAREVTIVSLGGRGKRYIVCHPLHTNNHPVVLIGKDWKTRKCQVGTGGVIAACRLGYAASYCFCIGHIAIDVILRILLDGEIVAVPDGFSAVLVE